MTLFRISNSANKRYQRARVTPFYLCQVASWIPFQLATPFHYLSYHRQSQTKWPNTSNTEIKKSRTKAGFTHKFLKIQSQD